MPPLFESMMRLHCRPTARRNPSCIRVIRIAARCDKRSLTRLHHSAESIRMANKYVTDEARKQIGKVTESRTVEVERGAIRRFAEAIGDSNPVFNSETEARKSRFGGMIAPPTFCR